jgi:hypothetical protein
MLTASQSPWAKALLADGHPGSRGSVANQSAARLSAKASGRQGLFRLPLRRGKAKDFCNLRCSLAPHIVSTALKFNHSRFAESD